MKKLILIVPIILLYCLGCDYATNYDVVLKGNSRHQDNGSVNQVEINNALQIIEETVEFYKLAQKTTVPEDVAHLKPIAIYRETSVKLVSGNLSIIVYIEGDQNLVININGLSPNRQDNRKIVEEIKNQLYNWLSSEFGPERVMVNNNPEIIKVAGPF